MFGVDGVARDPIQLSIAGDGRFVRLTPWTIRQFMHQIALSNRNSKYLASLFSFPWLKRPGQASAGWQRLKQRDDISNLEIAKIEKQANSFLARDIIALSSRPATVLPSFVPSKGPIGSRRAKMLPLNGLALELREISHQSLLDRQAETIVVTANKLYGSFKLLRLHGLRTTGKASQRTLSCIFSSFYDRALEHEYSLAEFHNCRWHQVVGIGALDGFTIVGMSDVPQERYARTLTTEGTRKAKLAKLRRRFSLHRKPGNAEPTTPGKGGVATAPGQEAAENDPMDNRLAQAIQTFTNFHIWEQLISGKAVDPYFDGTTGEFIRWVTDVEAQFLVEFKKIESYIFFYLSSCPTDRGQAISYIKNSKFPSITFAAYNNKPYHKLIWKLLRPQQLESFRPIR